MADKETQAVKAEDSMSTAPVQEAVVEPKVTEPKVVEPTMVTIELIDTFYNNGDTVTVYGPGKVTVTEDVAEDLLRRQKEVLKAERERLNGADKSSGEIGRV